MQRNLPHIISQATNAPLLLEPAYARVFFCALGRESGVDSLHIPQNLENLDQGVWSLLPEIICPETNHGRVFTRW